MTKKLTIVISASILLAGCAQFAEMEAARETGSAYLFGRFDEQICELESMAAKSPQLHYSVPRIVHEVIPSRPQTKTGLLCTVRTEYATPQAKIRFYGKKVECPATKEEVESWIKTIDGNIAKLKAKLKEVEGSYAQGVESIADANRQGSVRITNGTATVDKLSPTAGIKKDEKSGKNINELLPDFCKKQNVDPATVVSGDVELEYLGYASRPYGLRWTTEGFERQCHIVTTNLLSALKRTAIPAAANKVEADLAPILSTVNSNGLLNINWDVVSVNYKHHELLKRNNINLFNTHYNEEIKRNIETLTNAFAKVNGKSLGPILQIHDENGEKRIAFDRDKYCEILENRIVDGMNKKFSSYGNRPMLDFADFKSHVEVKLGSEIEEGLIYIRKGQFNKLSIDFLRCTKDGHGCTTYNVTQCNKFATEYAKAKAIVAKEEEKLAARTRLAKEYMNMPEGEKFPLLSVQPKPQMLMKDIQSGVSMKWIEGWLTANKVEFTGPEKEEEERSIDEILEKRPKRYTDNEYISAKFYSDGKLARLVTFWFKEKVLFELAISIRGTIPHVDNIVAKYSKELGSAASVEHGKKGTPQITPDGNLGFFTQDCFVRISNDDIGVYAGYKTFVGLIGVSEATNRRLQFMSAEQQMQYLEFSEKGKADLIINADGSIVRCTENGRLIKDIALPRLPELSKNDGLVNTITVWDKKLNAHFKNKKEQKAEATRKAAEEAKKAKTAAALDF